MPNSNQFFRNEINSIKNKDGELPALTITGSLSGSTKSFSLTPRQQEKVTNTLESFNEHALSKLAYATLSLFGIGTDDSLVDTSAGDKTISEFGTLITEIIQAISNAAAAKTTVHGNKYQNEYDAYIEIANALIKLFDLPLVPKSNKSYNTILGRKTKAEIGEYLTLLVKDESFQDQLISASCN